MCSSRASSPSGAVHSSKVHSTESFKEEALRNGPEGMYEAFFCEHNQYIAALTVLEAVDLPYMPTRNLIETERTRVIDMAKELLAVG